MSEHRRGVDEADVVRALQRAGTADAGVDVNALTAGARGRARTIRRRRQGIAGAVAVLALGVPIGLSQWPGTTSTNLPPATRTTSPAVVATIPDALLPTTQEVTAVVPGLTPTDSNPSTDTGFCLDQPYDGTSTVVDSRNLGWGGTQTVLATPFPETANLRVLLFRGAAAQDWMAQVATDAQSCTVQGADTAAYQLSDDVGITADQVVAGVAQYQPSNDNPMWRAIVVARSGQLVVSATVETFQQTSSDSLTQAADLVRAELAKAAPLRNAGGAAR